MTKEHSTLKVLALAQGAFYVLTGLWAPISPSTFQKVTGPKIDYWLVNTVGILVAVIGGVILLAGIRRRITPEIRLLAVGSALGLAGVDIVYVLRRRIAPVYLLDALAELGLVAGWLSQYTSVQTQAERNERLFQHKTKAPASRTD